MPKPPKESIGGRLVSRLSTNLKDKHKKLDFLMSLVIFIAVCIEYYSWTLQTDNVAKIVDEGDRYLTYWHPFLSSLTIWVFSWFFLLKVFRYKACIYSQLASILYWLVQSVTITAFLCKFGTEIYDSIVYPILLWGIIITLNIKAVRWFICKQR